MAQALDYAAGAAGDARPGFFARINKAVADYRLYRQTVDELAGLSDRDLSDLGLSRLSIRDIAYDSVYGA